MTARAYAKSLVKHYVDSPLRQSIEETFLPNLANTVRTHAALKPHVHTVRFRVKDPAHLLGKLLRKRAMLTGSRRITRDNLFNRVSDLAGLQAGFSMNLLFAVCTSAFILILIKGGRHDETA